MVSFCFTPWFAATSSYFILFIMKVCDFFFLTISVLFVIRVSNEKNLVTFCGLDI